MPIETELKSKEELEKEENKKEKKENKEEKIFSQKPDKDIENTKTNMVNFAGDNF